MNPDEIIQSAMGAAGKMIGGQELFILEGHSERNEFRILNSDDVLKNNIAAFAHGLTTGYCYLGMYTTAQAAEEVIETIRTLIRDESGKRMS